MDKQRLETIVKKIRGLPTLPSVAQRIIQIVNDPTATIKELTETVMLEPALTTKIIKLVNSAFYGFPRKIETINQAIVILGFNTIRSLALSLSMMDYFSGALASRSRLNFTEYWRHSVAVAILSRRLAEERFKDIAEEVFLAGLLHDVGIIMLDQYFPHEYEVVLESVAADRRQIQDAEDEILGVNHAAVSSMIFQAWNFPESICMGIEKHHHPDPQDPFFRHAACLHLADIGVKLMKIGDVGDADFIQFSHANQAAVQEMGIEEKFVDVFRPDVDRAVKEAERHMGIS